MRRSPLRDAFAELGRHRGDLAASIVCHLGERALLLSLPLLATRVVGGAAASGALPVDMVGLTAGAVFGLAALRYLGTFFGVRAQERAIRALRGQVLDGALRVPLGAMQIRRPGELAHILGHGSEQLVHTAADLVRGIGPTVASLVGAFVLLCLIDVELAAVAVPTVAFALIGVRLLGRRARPSMARAARTTSHLDGFVQESVSLMPSLRAHGAETHRLQGHAALLDDQLAARLRQQRALSWLGALSIVLGSAALFAVALMGTARLTSGDLAPLELVEALLLSFLLVSPLATLAELYGQLGKALAVSEQLEEILSLPREDPDRGQPLPDGPGEVALDRVSFAYPERTALLEELSLVCPAGKTTALVGANGAGKTTVLRLLLRFVEPDAGCVRIDGVDLAGVSPASLRRAVGLVAQDEPLALGTIRDNVAFGGEALSDDAVVGALTRAGLGGFVDQLPDGVDTVVGSGGAALSGGQRTGLQIARALARQPRILLLDEPTASLDADARAQVIATVRELGGSATIVIATHDDELTAVADVTHRLGG